MGRKCDPLEIEQIKSRLLIALSSHVGRSRIIGMGELYEQVFGGHWDHRINDTKRLREFITILRRDGTPICSDSSSAGGGYFIASTSGELNAFLDRYKSAALRKLGMCAAMKCTSLPEYLGQVQLELESSQ